MTLPPFVARASGRPQHDGASVITKQWKIRHDGQEQHAFRGAKREGGACDDQQALRLSYKRQQGEGSKRETGCNRPMIGILGLNLGQPGNNKELPSRRDGDKSPKCPAPARPSGNAVIRELGPRVLGMGHASEGFRAQGTMFPDPD